MERPVIHEGRAEAAGKRKDLCVILYMRNWVLQKKREDDYEMLKENIGSRDTQTEGPQTGQETESQPRLNHAHHQEVSISLSSNPETVCFHWSDQLQMIGREPPVSSLLVSFVVFSRILLKSWYLEWGEPQLVPSDWVHSLEIMYQTHYSCFLWRSTTCIQCQESFLTRLFRIAVGEVLQQQKVAVGVSHGFISSGNSV